MSTTTRFPEPRSAPAGHRGAARRSPAVAQTSADTPSIAVIGCGFAGLCLGMLLKQAGIASFTILEKADRLGGTWRDNVYPGAACDIPSLAYCFSFERKVDWSRKWAPQEEILAYMDHCADKWGLRPHVRLGTEVANARFQEETASWRIETTRGDAVAADVVVSAVGQLNRPRVPPIRDIDLFSGPTFHSARWPAGDDLGGRRVAVIGNAASAVQIVPAIAPRVSSLYVFQRSANWVVPKNDRAYTAFEHAAFRAFPALALLRRWMIWSINEARFPLFRKNPLFAAWATWIATRHLQDQVADEALRRTLTPDYPVGAKRLLITDDYYPALQRPNVRLVTTPIERATPEGLVTRDGETIAVDTIVFATGFESTAFLAPMRVEGLEGRTLESTWQGGAESYLGMSVAGFPNFFLMYGPNTNLGHNSILFMLECQANYIVACIREMMRLGIGSIDVAPERQALYNAEIQNALAGTVWADVARSWYKHASGRITNNWPYTTARYYLRTRRVDLGPYRQTLRTRPWNGATATAQPHRVATSPPR